MASSDSYAIPYTTHALIHLRHLRAIDKIPPVSLLIMVYREEEEQWSIRRLYLSPFVFCLVLSCLLI